MLRPLLAAALLFALPTLADEEQRERTDPQAVYSAEAVVQAAKLQPAQDDGLAWVEVSLKITRCIAGPCFVGHLEKVMVSIDVWRARHGDKMGLVRYEWKDEHQNPRTWALALRLDSSDENERFERETEAAVANVGVSTGDAVVATR